MRDSHFSDPAGLGPANVASARDTARMVRAVMSYPLGQRQAIQRPR